jgi:hypothetical protein
MVEVEPDRPVPFLEDRVDGPPNLVAQASGPLLTLLRTLEKPATERTKALSRDQSELAL